MIVEKVTLIEEMIITLQLHDQLLCLNSEFQLYTAGINADKRADAFAVCRVAAVVVALSPYFTSTFRRRVLSTTRADTSMELEPALV